MRKKCILIVVLFVISHSIIACLSTNKMTHQNDIVKVLVSIPPYSTDPIEYDAHVHHMIFTSVLSPLITNYKLGEYVGILAKSWKVNDDFTNLTNSAL